MWLCVVCERLPNVDHVLSPCLLCPCLLCSLKRETENANLILSWVDEHLEKRTTAGVKIAKAFENLLDAIGNRMYLSVTLATDKKIAFKAYANINSAGKPLTSADVLKAYLVQDISTGVLPLLKM